MSYRKMHYNKRFKKEWVMMSEEEKECMKNIIPDDWIQRWINEEQELSQCEHYMAIQLMRKNMDIKRILSYGFEHDSQGGNCNE